MDHTALLLNAVVRGEDCKTPWERARGRPFDQYMLGIAESVLFKFPVKGPRSYPDGNMGRQWGDGVFLDYHRSLNTYTVAMPDGNLSR